MAEGTVTIINIIVVDVGVCALLAIAIYLWRHRRRKEPVFMDLRRRLVVKVETFRYGGARLYHQTDDATAKIILKEGMKPGNGGVAGGGIYFATTPELTGHKAHKKGVILEATVDLGRIHTLEAAGDPSMTPERLKAMNFESVCIARPVSSGHEYVVYDPKQVLSIRLHSTVEPRERDHNDLEQGNGSSRGNAADAPPSTRAPVFGGGGGGAGRSSADPAVHIDTSAAWSWLDDDGRWNPYEGALAASIEAAFGDANRDTVDLAAGRHTPIWGSFERNRGTWTPYSADETAAIEDAFARGHQSINLPTCFNATIHFNQIGGHHHQTTPAVGSKPEGYRSVLRGKAGMKATLHHDGSMWRLELPNFHKGHEQQVEIWGICSTYVINFDDMMQYNVSTRRGRPVRREVPADPVVDGTWEWQDTYGSWKAYDPSACGQIALARRAGRKGTLLYAGRGKYWVDLSRSVQINMSTRNERPIRHRAGGQSWREPMVEVALDSWRKVQKWLAEKAAADKAAADKAAADKAAAEAEAKAAAEKAAALQRFDGDAPKVDQLLAKMREIYKDFSRDDARVALMEYGHDRSGHDRPVEEIVQIIHSHSC